MSIVQPFCKYAIAFNLIANVVLPRNVRLVSLVGVRDDLGLGEEIRVLLVRGDLEWFIAPQLRRQVSVGLSEGSEDGLDEVTEGTGVSGGGGVAIFNSSHVQQLLGDRGSDEPGTTRSRNQTDTDGTALSGHLARDGVRKTDVLAPESTADRNKGDLGHDDGTADSGGNFSSGLESEANVSLFVTDSNESLEAGTLSSSGLLLDRHDLHDFVLEGAFRDEVVDDLVLLDSEGEQVDFFQAGDLALLDETAKFGDGDPFLGVVAASLTLALALSLALALAEAAAVALSFSSVTHVY